MRENQTRNSGPRNIVVFVVILLVSTIVANAAGQLDTSFGGTGKVRTGFPGTDFGSAIAVQSDGKRVVAGETDDATGVKAFLVVRYNPDGSLDSSFGTSGKVLTLFGSVGMGARAVKIQSDGKIVVTGYLLVNANGNANFITARYTPDGSLDTSFGFGGIVLTAIGESAFARGMVIQPDGKLVVAGGARFSNNSSAIVAVRYNPNGTVDSSFGSAGIAITHVPDWQHANGSAVALQSDGKIAVSGFVFPATFTESHFAVVRYNTNGSLDTSFGPGGTVVTPFALNSIANSIAVQTDQVSQSVALVVAGKTTADCALAKYNLNGTLDTTFNGTGKTTIDFGGADECNTLLIQGTLVQPRKYIVTGYRVTPGPTRSEIILARLSSDGSLDTTFGSNGQLITAIGTESSAHGAALQSGKIVVSGSARQGASAPYHDDFATVSYNLNGFLDPTFNGTGIKVDGFAMFSSWIARGMALQSDGKAVVVGRLPSVQTFAVARFEQDGSPDLGFGQQGFLVTPFSSQQLIANDVAIQADGKIVAAGCARCADPADVGAQFAVARYHPNGTLDDGFGIEGRVLTGFGPATPSIARTLAIQQDGKILVVGVRSAVIGGLPDNAIGIMRLATDGSLDASFGSGGRKAISVGTSSIVINSVAIQSDGRIVIAGALNAKLYVARLLVNGDLDTSFNGTGSATLSQSSGGNAVKVQADGKIVVAGYINPGGGDQFALARFTTGGAFDTSFGVGFGLVTTVVSPAGSSQANALEIQPDGKLLASGFTFNGTKNVFSAVRYRRDGAIDAGYGSNGRTFVDFAGSSDDKAYASALDSSGRLVLAGDSSDRVGIARLTPGGGAPYDFDGDGKTDIGIFRPAVTGGEWWINRSSNAETFALQFGASTDRIAPADYTGDGKVDITFFRPASGEWYVLRSEDFSFFAVPFGANGDIPVPADYDADGKADFAVFRPASATWFISQSSGAPTRILQFGVNGDQPVVSDYDGDGKADVGIYRPGPREWWIARSTAGLLAVQFGNTGDRAVQGDYTGDGKADIALWRPSTGEWFIVRSENLSFFGFPFGTNGDTPAPGDYDGDGKFDAAVFRPSNATWFIARSSAGTQIVQFGATGDQPIPNAFVP